MPDIDKIPEVLHKATDPYHFTFDNVPLENILQRQKVINAAVDNNSQQIRNSVGTAGSLDNRLNKSLESDGTLKTSELDSALHNIGAHADGSHGGVDYVRMTQDERDKLSLVSEEATALKIQFNTVSTTPLFEDETVEFIDSDTAAWALEGTNKIRVDLAFPSESAHKHFYDREPVHVNLASPNFIDYKTTTTNTAYNTGTLRVYVNGIRLTAGIGVWVPPSTGPNGTWILTYFTEVAPASGTFSFNRALDSSDIVRIDFNSNF